MLRGRRGAAVGDISRKGFACVILLGALTVGSPAVAAVPRCTIVSMSAGSDFSLAIAQDGSLYGWGDGFLGQLARGETAFYPRPVRSLNPGPMAAVAGGVVHAVGIEAGGIPWAWGEGDWGQRGDGTWNLYSFVPVPVVGLPFVTTMATGGDHTLALDGTGAVWSWGDNSQGQLGDGTTNRSNVPIPVQGISGVTGVAGFDHSLAVKSDGTLWAWGNNQCAQLGDGTFDNKILPVRTSGLSTVTAVSAGVCHSLALKADGTVWAWGWGAEGQLGDGAGVGRRFPVRVINLTNAVAIEAGGGHSLAIRDDGTLWAWGYDGDGQIGDGPPPFDQWSPVQVFGLSNVTAVSAGSHSLALTADGTLWSWGRGDEGQLGNGSLADAFRPVPVNFDYRPEDQGNVLKAVKAGRDVVLSFDGALALLWKLYADAAPAARGTTGLSPELTDRFYVDSRAVDRPDPQYYYLRGLSLCSSNPGL